MKTKVKSFTLSEVLVTMIITVIVVGIAFTVLNLVIKEVSEIQLNYGANTEKTLFKERLWLDFNNSNEITFLDDKNSLEIKANEEIIMYNFQDDFVLRNQDTIKMNIKIDKVFFQGNQIKKGTIDAVSLMEEEKSIEHKIFVFKKNDATFFMNQDGI